jgi:cytochrome b6-f complex iron-sulfur subunit
MNPLISILVFLGAATAFVMTPKQSYISPTFVKSMEADLEDFYIDRERRNTLNLILLASAATTVSGLAIPYLAFFVPPSAGGGTGAINAKDAVGTDIVASKYLASKPAGDRSLVQGLRGDAT